MKINKQNMFHLIEPLRNSTISQTKSFELGDLQNGVNLFEDFIIFKKNKITTNGY